MIFSKYMPNMNLDGGWVLCVGRRQGRLLAQRSLTLYCPEQVNSQPWTCIPHLATQGPGRQARHHLLTLKCFPGLLPRHPRDRWTSWESLPAYLLVEWLANSLTFLEGVFFPVKWEIIIVSTPLWAGRLEWVNIWKGVREVSGTELPLCVLYSRWVPYNNKY